MSFTEADILRLECQTPPRDHIIHPSPFRQRNNRKRQLSPSPSLSLLSSNSVNSNKRVRLNDHANNNHNSNNNNHIPNATSGLSISSNQAVASIISLVEERDTLKAQNNVLQANEMVTKRRLDALKNTNNSLQRRVGTLSRKHKEEMEKVKRSLVVENTNLSKSIARLTKQNCGNRKLWKKQMDELKTQNNALQNDKNNLGREMAMFKRQHKETLNQMEQAYTKQNNDLNLVQKQRDILRKAVDSKDKIINGCRRAQHEMGVRYQRMVYNQKCTITNMKQAHAQSMMTNKAKIIEMHQQMTVMKGTINNLKMGHEEEQKKMKKQLMKMTKTISECEELRKKVDLYEGKAEMIDTMTLAQLNELKRTLQETMNEIETAKEKKEECVICKDNPCNIAFIGCGHCVICEECERNQTEKVCPQCRNPYTQVLKIAK